MSRNKLYTSLAGHLKELSERLTRFQKSHTIGRHRTVWLTDRVSALSSTGLSTATFTDLDLSSFTSSGTSDISDNSIQVLLLVEFRDSGSSGTQTTIALRKKGGTGNGGLIVHGHHINDEYAYAQGWVGIDADYTLQYSRTASGAGTLDLNIYLVGYREQLGPIT